MAEHDRTRPRGARPTILIPARFSRHASALRYEAEVAARALVEAVFAGGGEPLLMHPHAPGDSVGDDEIRARLQVADGVLLPGGGDLDPAWSGQAPHPDQYDVDVQQDAFDLGVARVALTDGIPLLAICRGTQVVNVLLGGDIVQDMTDRTLTAGRATGAGHHRELTHHVAVLQAAPIEISCYHHQCLGRLGAGLEVVARADDGVIEAVRLGATSPYRGWFMGVQWHPEDTAATDHNQAALFGRLVQEARSYRG